MPAISDHEQNGSVTYFEYICVSIFSVQEN